MVLKNKKWILITSLLILLPIPVMAVLSGRLTAEYLHSFGGFLYAAPVVFLLSHWFCIWASEKLDTSNREKNPKPLRVVLWVIPLLSNLMAGVMYALMLGFQFSPFSYMAGAFGLMFAAIGNYLPKTRMNSTMGIKIKWTYSSEANWNATHRFAGKLWFFGGIALLVAIFLPENWAVGYLFLTLLVMTLLPMYYSWNFYRKELAEGKEMKSGYPSLNPKATKAIRVFVCLLVVFFSAVMFAGDLTYTMGEESFTIEADWYSDLTVSYDSIIALEFREESVPGERVGGYGSMRLLMGFFRNEEFGNYVRYTYYKPEACIILTMERQTVVISAETLPETKALYDTLSEKLA